MRFQRAQCRVFSPAPSCGCHALRCILRGVKENRKPGLLPWRRMMGGRAVRWRETAGVAADDLAS
jgi:hypothetical protein